MRHTLTMYCNMDVFISLINPCYVFQNTSESEENTPSPEEVKEEPPKKSHEFDAKIVSHVTAVYYVVL